MLSPVLQVNRQQFNASVQYELTRNPTLQAAYVGTRGLRLYRINQAQIATLTLPILNAVTGEVIATNTPDTPCSERPCKAFGRTAKD